VLDGKKMLVLLNFKSQPAKVNTGFDLSKAKLLIGNYPTPSKGETLQPYESIVYEL
jgi:oligo-1,6-glucosidase